MTILLKCFFPTNITELHCISWYITKQFSAEECELESVRQCQGLQPPVMREVVLVLTLTLTTTH